MSVRATYTDYLIIGGGIAGMGAAEAIRENDIAGKIAILSRGKELLYSKVLLGSYVRKEIPKDSVFLRTQKDYVKLRIDLLAGEEAVAVDVNKREVQTSFNRIISYKKLLIACGSKEKRMHKENERDGRMLHLRTLEDARHAREIIAGSESLEKKDVLVAGDGFASLEFLESAIAYGYKPHVFLESGMFWDKFLDSDGVDFLKTRMERIGIVFHPNQEVKLIRPAGDKHGINIVSASGQELLLSWAGVETVIEPNVEMFRAVGLPLNKGVVVDEHMASGIENIWSAGSVAECNHPVYGAGQIFDTWVTAYSQGIVAGFNMSKNETATEKKVFNLIPTLSVTFLGLHITFLGNQMWHDCESIVRYLPDEEIYERLFLRDGALAGAIIINKFRDKLIYEELIKNKTGLSGYLGILNEAGSDVASILQQ